VESPFVSLIFFFLSIENKYYDLVKISNKELNKNLNLPKLNTLKEVLDKFEELYECELDD
jgi:hypothetical protein